MLFCCWVALIVGDFGQKGLLLTTGVSVASLPSQPSPTKACNCSRTATSPPSQAMSLQVSLPDCRLWQLDIGW